MRIATTENAPTPYNLIRALLLYQDKERQALVAVEHDIVQQGAEPKFGPGRMVTSAFINSLLEMTDRLPLQYVPPHIIAVSRDAVAWFDPAQPRRMLFQVAGDTAVNAFDNIEIAQPPLVFIARRHSLYVYALFKNERPSMDTLLAMAPYFNVYDRHNVCLGSMQVPETVNTTDTYAWTNAFFASNFTHLSSSTKRWAHTGTYTELLTDVVKTGQFDPAWLKPSKLDLNEAICSS